MTCPLQKWRVAKNACVPECTGSVTKMAYNAMSFTLRGVIYPTYRWQGRHPRQILPRASATPERCSGGARRLWGARKYGRNSRPTQPPRRIPKHAYAVISEMRRGLCKGRIFNLDPRVGRIHLGEWRFLVIGELITSGGGGGGQDGIWWNNVCGIRNEKIYEEPSVFGDIPLGHLSVWLDKFKRKNSGNLCDISANLPLT